MLMSTNQSDESIISKKITEEVLRHIFGFLVEKKGIVIRDVLK